MKVLLLAIFIYAISINCNHSPKCETWKEHKAKITKLPGNGFM